MNVYGLLGSALGLAQDPDASERFERKVVEAAVACGFRRARFWTYAHDLTARSELLVLVAHHEEERSDPPAYSVGLDLELKVAHVRPTGKEGAPRFEPILVDYDRPKDEDQEITAKLGLRGLVVEVPIFSSATLDGILALELPDGGAITSSEMQTLQAVGFIIGQRLALDLSQAEDKLMALPREERRATRAVLRTTLENIAVELSGAIVAAFEWNLETNLLKKVDEVFHPSLQAQHGDSAMGLTEQYDPGQYLTGKAWVNENARYIYSFQGLGESSPQDVALDSLRWHTPRLGVVRSVLYDVLVPEESSRSGSQYLVRVLNHVSDNQVPFVASDARLLSRICDRASSLLEDARAADRLSHVIRLSSVAVQDLSTFLAELSVAVAVEGISGLLLLGTSTSADTESFDFVRTLGTVRLDTAVESFLSPSANELVTVAHLHPCEWIPIGNSQLERALHGAGYRSMLMVAFSAGTAYGVMLVPSRSLANERTIQTRRLGRGSQRYLEACAEVLGRSLEIRRSEQLATGALQALGYLGHEMGTPMTQLGSLAVKATSSAFSLAQKMVRQRAVVLRRERELGGVLHLEEIKELAPMISEIKTIELELVYRSDFLASLLSLAPIFALRSDRSVRVNYQPIATATLVSEAVLRTREDPLLQPDARDSIVRHRWNIVQSGSVSAERKVTCDRYFASVAISCLLRNAVKYSVPRPGSTTSTIAINLQAQREWLDIIVTNYGIGIPNEERHAIFEPFTQGTNYESVRAVRGMGLGLYLCRVLASAHGGEVRLVSSKPLDFADPERLKRMEGYETVFRLRISNRLSTGVYEVPVDVTR